MKDAIEIVKDKGENNMVNPEMVRSEGDGDVVDGRNAHYAVETKRALKARFAYGFIFFLTNLLAWVVRDYGHPLMANLHYLKECHTGKECFHAEGVLRIFFFCMFLTTFRARKLDEVSNLWHSGWWFLKFVIWISFVPIPFFIPSGFIQIYGEVARFGAGIFLLIQLISVIQFILWWNKYCMPDDTVKQSCFIGLFMATISYVAAICGILMMYLWYARGPSFLLNIFFITWTAVLLKVMMIVPLHSKFAYLAYFFLLFLMYGFDRSTEAFFLLESWVVTLFFSVGLLLKEAEASRGHREGPRFIARYILVFLSETSFLFAICAIVVATFSTGIDSKSFQFRKDEVQFEDDIPYKYGFFHVIFSLGAMYFAMLFVSWDLKHSIKKWSIDVGWASTWVKIVNEWFAATIYLWTLVPPLVKKHDKGSALDMHETV